jgi:hypothetical protein
VSGDISPLAASSANNIDTDIEDAYGELEGVGGYQGPRRHREFQPWHHPVKQAVRAGQWAAQIERLIGDGHVEGDSLRYLTLPGADMMDVRYIGGRLRARGGAPSLIEVFGFDSSKADFDRFGSQQALATLRQDQLASLESSLHVGRIEEITVDKSLAQRALKQAQPFDVINLDACNYLCADKANGQPSLFGALNVLMQHQLPRHRAWLLFITTRADAANFNGQVADQLKSLVNQNIEHDGADFIDALNALTGLKETDGGSSAAWAATDKLFLKMFAVGLGKYILHYFNNQLLFRARVTLHSTFGYRVSGVHPDMLALAFRVSPNQEGGLGVPAERIASVPIPQPNIDDIVKMVQRASILLDVDDTIQKDHSIRSSTVKEQADLLRATGYSLREWMAWLKGHPVRPLECHEILADLDAEDAGVSPG